ncbi:hypothetical protein MTO96_003171 [Rhipicephalus appendiculatus]
MPDDESARGLLSLTRGGHTPDDEQPLELFLARLRLRCPQLDSARLAARTRWSPISRTRSFLYNHAVLSVLSRRKSSGLADPRERPCTPRDFCRQTLPSARFTVLYPGAELSSLPLPGLSKATETPGG